MNIELGKPLACYFQAANAHDSALLADCFTEDAVVFDEGQEYRGLAAIMEWNEAVTRKYDLTLELVSSAQEDGLTVVTAEATGRFDGSPALIGYCFEQAGNKVTSLRCG